MLGIGNREILDQKADTFNTHLLNRNLRGFQGIDKVNPEGYELRILNVLLHSGCSVSLPIICDTLDIKRSNGKDYIKLYRLLDSLTSKKIITYEKIDGLKYYTATPSTIESLLGYRKSIKKQIDDRVDLIEAVSKTTYDEEKCKSAEIERMAWNLRFCRRSKFWKDVQFLMNYHQLTPFGWKRLNDYFIDYRENVEDKVLLFKKVGEDKYKSLPYTHRFQEKKVMDRIKEYNRIWDSANKFKFGVHLTVTFDATRTLGEINKTISDKFKWLISWVKATTKCKDLQYLKILEFQDNGRHHLHILFFGISRIADKKTILTPMLQKIGFGQVNFIYKLTNRGGRWIWAKARPEDAEHNNPRGHFKKYLEKALVEGHEKTAAYWLCNKKFYTCSYGLLDVCSREILEHSAEGWEYIGIFSTWDIPDFVFKQLRFDKELGLCG